MNYNELQNKWQSQKGDERLLSINSEMLLNDAINKMHKFEKFMSFGFKYFLILTIPLLIFNHVFEFLTFGKISFAKGELFFQLPVLLLITYWYFITNIKKYDSDNYTFVKSAIYKIKGGWVKYVFAAYFLGYWLLIPVFQGFYNVSSISTIFYLNILTLMLIVSYAVYFYFSMIRPALIQLKKLKKIYEEKE